MNLETPNNNDKSLFPDQEAEDEDDDSWQVSYLDIITILLGFLVILLSFSELNNGESFSVSELFKSSLNESEFITTPIEDIKIELESLLEPEIEQGQLEIFRELNDVKIRFKSDDLYTSGSAQLQDGATEILNRVLAAFKLISYTDFEIDVEGHTDNVPISSSSFDSNWELSTSRASNVVRYFNRMGISQERLKASGYADSRPLVEFDEEGNPYPANKDKNRRIVLRLFYSNPDQYAVNTIDSTITTEDQTDSLVSETEISIPPVLDQEIQQPPESITYQIQLGFFRSEENARSFRQVLIDEYGLDVVIEETSNQAFKVLSSSYLDIDEANETLNELKQNATLKDAYIIINPI